MNIISVNNIKQISCVKVAERVLPFALFLVTA
jgi:hypothetical protein